LVLLLVTSGARAAPSRSEEKPPDPAVANGVEPVLVDEPAFPSPMPKDRVKIWTGAYFAPPADFGDVDLGLTRTELRFRGRLPVNGTASVQVTGDFRASLYDEDGSGSLFADCSDCPSPGSLYSALLAVQGGYLINRNWQLFRDDEQWAIVGAFYGRARWEPGAFEESLTPGLSLGIGYQLPLKLRVAVTARVERALDGDGVKVAPSGYLRWYITPKLRLRNRGLGLELEYRPTNRVEVFVTGFQSSDRFRLDDRPGLSSAPTFSDRHIAVGGGLVFKIAHAFRVAFETGAIVDRRVYVNTRDDGRVDSTDGDISPYFALRAEIRP
jgi:hypothetical protein